MSVADMCILASVLVVIVVLAKMIRAIRLLDGRVSLLQEQVKIGRDAAGRANAIKPIAMRTTPARTPVAGVPVLPTAASTRRTPTTDETPEDRRLPGEMAPHVIDEAEAEAVWAKMEAEQERMRRAMGSDFRARTRKRSAEDIRGKPVVRAMSSQELLARRAENK